MACPAGGAAVPDPTYPVFYDHAENFHPYECDGPGKCRHCDRREEPNHDPKTCALCDDQGEEGQPDA